jgi:hypothetical protein
MLKCTAAWVSVENRVDRGNAGLWKAWEGDETVYTLPTALGNCCGNFTHSHRRDYDGTYVFQVPSVKRYEAESTVKHIPGPILECCGDVALSEKLSSRHGV